jgi:hypothetical protein
MSPPSKLCDHTNAARVRTSVRTTGSSDAQSSPPNFPETELIGKTGEPSRCYNHPAQHVSKGDGTMCSQRVLLSRHTARSWSSALRATTWSSASLESRNRSWRSWPGSTGARCRADAACVIRSQHQKKSATRKTLHSTLKVKQYGLQEKCSWIGSRVFHEHVGII